MGSTSILNGIATKRKHLLIMAGRLPPSIATPVAQHKKITLFICRWNFLLRIIHDYSIVFALIRAAGVPQPANC